MVELTALTTCWRGLQLVHEVCTALDLGSKKVQQIQIFKHLLLSTIISYNSVEYQVTKINKLGKWFLIACSNKSNVMGAIV